MITLFKNILDLFDTEKKRHDQEEQLRVVQNYFEDLTVKDGSGIASGKKTGDDIDSQRALLKTAAKSFPKAECSVHLGIVTRLNSDHGVIDNALAFKATDVSCMPYSDIKVGDEIKYSLHLNPENGLTTVVEILDAREEDWDGSNNEDEVKKETQNYLKSSKRAVMGKVKECRADCILISNEDQSMIVELDKVEYVPKKGDHVCLNCNVHVSDHFAETPEEILEVDSVHPQSSITGKKCTVQLLFNGYAQLNTDIYVTFDVLPNSYKMSLGDIVLADLISCNRGDYSYRCVKLTVLEKALPNQLRTSSKSTVQNKSHPIEISDRLYCVFAATFETKIVDVMVLNKTNKVMTMYSIAVVNMDSTVRLIDPLPTNSCIDLQPDEKRIVRFEVHSSFFGECRETIEFNFGKFVVRRFIRVIVCDGEEAANKAEANERMHVKEFMAEINSVTHNGGQFHRAQRQRLYANQVWSKKQAVVPGVGLMTKRRFVAVSINSYEVPERLRIAYLTAERSVEMAKTIKGFFPSLAAPLQNSNYTARFQALLHLEEIENFVSFRKYDREHASFTRDGDYLSLAVENLAERRPSLVIGDIVRASNSYVQHSTSFDGFIHKVLCDRVLLKFNSGFHANYKGEDYTVQFHFSRFTFRKMHHAITHLPVNLGEQFLFPTRMQLRDRPQLAVELNDAHEMQSDDGRDMQWFNPDLNSVQKRAVCNVLRGEAVLMPYVIFGPPGTGKTITLIEIILQLVKHLPDARVLVGTPSNSSADQIATRLIDSGELQPDDFVRLVSQNSVETENIPEHLLPYCVTPDFGIEGTCKSEMVVTDSGLKLHCQVGSLRRNRIIISTCITLGNLIPMGFRASHFTHVLMDEAAQTTEPEAMVPISLLTTEQSQVVLAGDSNQLSPVVMNVLAKESGLTVSLLERLITTCAPYVKNMDRFHEFCGYNPRLVTKLLHNYRALPSIMYTYNKLFYNNELVPMIDSKTSSEAHSLKELKKALPLLGRSKSGAFFCGMLSENKQDEDSPSWYNPLEAKNVFLMTMQMYKAGISPDNIGIITPYSRQVKHLRSLFTAVEIELPKIGSVEEFQGQERDIILVSTVRSTKQLITSDLRQALGFVQSFKRMNVAISRARYLLFIFGNPHLLALDDNWRSYIQYCIDENAYLGEIPEEFLTPQETP